MTEVLATPVETGATVHARGAGVRFDFDRRHRVVTKTLAHVRRLNEIATDRGQKLAQMALQWALRDPRVTSAVIGSSSVEQLDTNLDALSGPAFTDEELKAIDDDAVEAGVNLWAKSTED